jgi:maleate isomerase
MFGWRGRIGLIVPSSNTTLEPEMKAMCPEGVEVYATRVMFKSDEQGLREMKQYVRRASLELSSEGLSDIIVFGCTVGSLLEGKGYDEAICTEITSETGIPAITVTTAVLEALRTLNTSKVAVATPYTKRINDIEGAAFNSYDIEVVNIRGYYEEIADQDFTNMMIGALHDEDTYRFAKTVDREGADCLFISCTNLRTIGVIRLLEECIRKPVLSSNLCSMWLALRKLKISYQEKDLDSKGWNGTLMRSLVKKIHH